MDTKPWWQSTTIRGAIIALLGAVAAGLSLAGVVDIQGAEIEVIITGGLAAIGGVFAIIGRAKAKTKITGGKTP